jgi:hypothetical protein
MTNEERELISRFIARIGGAPAGGFAVPAQPPSAQPLPPVDPEADALIGELFARYPEARYRITQTAFVQEHALIEAQNRLQRLEWELQQARQALQQAQMQAPAPGQPGSPWGQPAPQGTPPAAGGGFFGGLFGGRPAPQPAAAAPYQQAYAPAPQYPAGYNPGMFQPSGSGFLGGALRTAAGVAGGVLAADAIASMFSGHHGGGFIPSAQAGEVMPGGIGAANPWAAPAAGVDPFDQGGAAKQEDASGWTDAAPADPSGGWTDAAADSSGGWSDAGGDTGGSDLEGGGDDWS